MSTIRAVARRFTSWNFAPCRSIAPSRSLVAASQYSGSRFYCFLTDDYKKAMVRTLHCNHPNCDNWDMSNGLSDPINMIDHWKHVHNYKGINFCKMCGNCIENDKLPCKSFPPLSETCPRKPSISYAELVEKNAQQRRMLQSATVSDDLKRNSQHKISKRSRRAKRKTDR